MNDLGLPDGFLFGAATAAYQIEGAAAEHGRTPSIWDTFAHTPGRTVDGDTGDVACDHYHRLDTDLDLIAGLNLGAYRFSVSWPRVLPGGGDRLNPNGVDFYERLVDGLLARGVEPWLTLYHWDLPQELEDAGGWPARDTAERFATYATRLHNVLGDRVTRWTTFNEPWCSAFLGYASGDHAPGRREPAGSLGAAHHLMLAHGLAARELTARGAQVGVTLNLYAISPAADTEADRDAARRIDGLANRYFLDPVLLGRYPQDVRNDLAGISDFGFVRDGDLDTIAAPLAMLGVNYYSRHVVAGAGDPAAYWRKPTAWPGSEHVRFTNRDGVPRTAMDWEIDAPGLGEVLRRVAADYPPVPLYVTENGAAFDDKLDGDAVHDRERVDYLAAHLRACAGAIADGVPLHGYFAWSLLDNFEWAWGYSRRFGLVYVDYADGQRRVRKDSADWYAGVAGAANRSGSR